MPGGLAASGKSTMGMLPPAGDFRSEEARARQRSTRLPSEPPGFSYGEVHEREGGNLDGRRPVMDVDELASLLGLSPKRVYALIAQKQIPGVIRLGRRILLSRQTVERWLDGTLTTPQAAEEDAARDQRG